MTNSWPLWHLQHQTLFTSVYVLDFNLHQIQLFEMVLISMTDMNPLMLLNAVAWAILRPVASVTLLVGGGHS